MKYMITLLLTGLVSLHGQAAAKFESLSGGVQIKIKDSKWSAAKLGQSLAADTIIATGPRGKAELVFPNGSTLRLNSLTQVTLDSYNFGKFGTQTVMSLRTGRVVAKIAKYKKGGASNYFLVRTPTAVAGVRGTIKEVAYSPDKGSEIKLVESEADVVDSSGKKSIVPEGGKSTVTTGETLTADKVATREAAATTNSQATTSANEVTISNNTGDFNFAPNARDFTDTQRLFDKFREDNFLELLKKPASGGGPAPVEDTLTVEKL